MSTHPYKLNHQYIVKNGNDTKKILVLELTKTSILITDVDSIYTNKARYHLDDFFNEWYFLEEIEIELKSTPSNITIKPIKLPESYLSFDVSAQDKVPFFTYCGCNPANGGSGICGCTMGRMMVDKRY